MAKHGHCKEMIAALAGTLAGAEGVREEADLCPMCFYTSMMMSLMMALVAGEHLTEGQTKEFLADLKSLTNGHVPSSSGTMH